jgi:hypothetical protein
MPENANGALARLNEVITPANRRKLLAYAFSVAGDVILNR